MASTVFLPAQPQTPPSDIDHAINEAIEFLDTSFDLDETPKFKKGSKPASEKNGYLETPPTSSPVKESHDGFELSDRPAKRLRFSELLIDDTPQNTPVDLKPVPPSRSLRSRQSILKSSGSMPSSPFDDSNLPSTQPPQTFSNMLERICKQLAGDDPATRLSAYGTLTRSMQENDDLPDPTALYKQLPLLENFIQRDLRNSESDINSTGRKISLQALKSTYMLLIKLTPERNFSADFLIFMVERSIRTITASNAPKEIVLHHAQLLTAAKMYTRVMSVERINRILNALSDIPSRVSGNNIIGVRLNIYVRIIRYNPIQLIERFEEILSHIFHGLLSSHKEVRSHAIHTGLVAATTFGHSRRVSTSVTSIFFQKSSTSRSYMSSVEEKLRLMLDDEDTCEHVPQVWSIIALLLRGNSTVLEKLLRRSELLKQMEISFNARNAKLNLQAWSTWSKIIFSANLSHRTRQSIIKMFRKPIIGHLQRRAHDQESMQVKDAALSSLCTLFYYSFRPGASSVQIDFYWREVIHEVLQHVESYSSADAKKLCRVMSILLYQPKRVVWNVNRIIEKRANIHWQEISPIDPSWLRKNTGQVLSSIEPLLRASSVSTSNDINSDEDLWSSLMTAISEASQKEVHTSNDLKIALAKILNFIVSIKSVRNDPNRPHKDIDHVKRGLVYAKQAAIILKPSRFSEKILKFRLDNETENFCDAVANSESYLQLSSNVISSPIGVLISGLAANTYETGGLCESLDDDLKSILSLCWEAAASGEPRLCLASSWLEALALADPGYKIYSDSSFFRIIGEFLIQSPEGLDNSRAPLEAPKNSHTSPHLLPKAISCLWETISVHRKLCNDESHTRVQQLHLSTERSPGCNWPTIAAFKIYSLIVSNLFRDPDVFGSYRHSPLKCGTAMINFFNATFFDAETLLLSTPPTGKISIREMTATAEDWCDEVFLYIAHQVEAVFRHKEDLDLSVTQDFLKSVTSLLRSILFKKRDPVTLEHPLKTLVNNGLFSSSECYHSLVASWEEKQPSIWQAFRNLWQVILESVSWVAILDHFDLTKWETLFCAAFQSQDRRIFELAWRCWQNSYGLQNSLDYPDKLSRVVLELRKHVQIDLPGLMECAAEEAQEDTQCMPLPEWLNNESRQTRLTRLDLDSTQPAPVLLSMSEVSPLGHKFSNLSTRAILLPLDARVQYDESDRPSSPPELQEHKTSAEATADLPEQNEPVSVAVQVTSSFATREATGIDVCDDTTATDQTPNLILPETEVLQSLDPNTASQASRSHKGCQVEHGSTISRIEDSFVERKSSDNEMDRQTRGILRRASLRSQSRSISQSLPKSPIVVRAGAGSGVGESGPLKRKRSAPSPLPRPTLRTRSQTAKAAGSRNINETQNCKQNDEDATEIQTSKKGDQEGEEEEEEEEDLIVLANSSADAPSLSQIVSDLQPGTRASEFPAKGKSTPNRLIEQSSAPQVQRARSTSTSLTPGRRTSSRRLSRAPKVLQEPSSSSVCIIKDTPLHDLPSLPKGNGQQQQGQQEQEQTQSEHENGHKKRTRSAQADGTDGPSRKYLKDVDGTRVPLPHLFGGNADGGNDALESVDIGDEEMWPQHEDESGIVGAFTSSQGQVRTARTFAKYVIRKLSRVVEDCKNLFFLGSDNLRPERDALHSLSYNLQGEILAAEQRGQVTSLSAESAVAPDPAALQERRDE